MMAEVWNMLYSIKTRLTMLQTKHNMFWAFLAKQASMAEGWNVLYLMGILHTKQNTFKPFMTSYLRQLPIISYTDWRRRLSATRQPARPPPDSKFSVRTDMLVMLPGFKHCC